MQALYLTRNARGLPASARRYMAREFYLVVRLKNEKRETVYSLLSTIEESLHKSGLPVRRAGREDLKRILALYFEENTTSERMEDYDGQRFLEG
jgi:hypothetical protein